MLIGVYSNLFAYLYNWSFQFPKLYLGIFKAHMQPWNNQIRLLLSFSPSHKSDISKMSAQRQVVNSDQAPPPRPFYNQAVIANGFVFCSGQLPKDSNGKIVQGNVQDRAVCVNTHDLYPILLVNSMKMRCLADKNDRSNVSKI